MIAEFYNDDRLIFPEADVCKFGDYRRKIMANFIQALSRVSFFEIGDLPLESTADFQKIREYADARNVKAMLRYGRMTNDTRYLKESADRGDKSSQFYYSTLCDDEDQALDYLQRPASQDYVKALEKCGTMMNDVGSLKRAADLGSETAQLAYYQKAGQVA